LNETDGIGTSCHHHRLHTLSPPETPVTKWTPSDTLLPLHQPPASPGPRHFRRPHHTTRIPLIPTNDTTRIAAPTTHCTTTPLIPPTHVTPVPEGLPIRRITCILPDPTTISIRVEREEKKK
jgi:hypothetical protein